MSLWRKLFGKKQKEEVIEAPSPDTNELPNQTITIFDKFGRQMEVDKITWKRDVLIPNLKLVWEKPDELAQQIITALQDGFEHEIEEGAKQLVRLEPNESRSVVLLGSVYLKTDRPRLCESILEKFTQNNGEEGVVFTNLAKAQYALGQEDLAMDTLWKALELDPNQDNGMQWYIVEYKEKYGGNAAKEALERISQIPSSWRSQLWLARELIEESDLDGAMSLYQEALNKVVAPVPVDLLMQMSGDLGNAGYLMELINLVSPHYDSEVHGLVVGNNLIKGCLDLGNIVQAKTLLRGLQVQNRPDWKDTLSYWENELAHINVNTEDTYEKKEIQLTNLMVGGAVWHSKEISKLDLIPKKSSDSAKVLFIGSSVESLKKLDKVQLQLSDSGGRASRAIPCYLAEEFALKTNVNSHTVIPWILNGNGCFMVSGMEIEDEHVVNFVTGQSRDSSTIKADYVVKSHLITQGENWTVKMQLHRVIDSKVLWEKKYPCAEGGLNLILPEVYRDLYSKLDEESGIDARVLSDLEGLKGEELEHYLFRLEQTLAVRCAAISSSNGKSLTHVPEILKGVMDLNLHSPLDVKSRLLLIATISYLKKIEPELVKSYRPNLIELQNNFPTKVVSVNELAGEIFEQND